MKGEIKDGGGEVAARYEIYDTGSSKVELDLGPVMGSLGVLYVLARSHPIFNVEAREGSPWVEVKAGDEEYAIWRATGDIYRLGADGAVQDEPLLRMLA